MCACVEAAHLAVTSMGTWYILTWQVNIELVFMSQGTLLITLKHDTAPPPYSR